ncbi:MAG TPA: hypothetical protein VN841_25470 [Bryobacteraceae bacterium]|nr:hypothetical protein [Bryobacteraceae bacterium]
MLPTKTAPHSNNSATPTWTISNPLTNPDLVETMAAARWRLNHLQEIEATPFDKEMVVRVKETNKQLADLTEVEKLTWVFDRVANHSKSLAMLIRYEGSLNRSYERAFKQLQQLQRQVAQASACESAEIQNEPEPLAPTVPSATVQPLVGPSEPPATPKTSPSEPPIAVELRST